jgi:Uma2 family endonuclease
VIQSRLRPKLPDLIVHDYAPLDAMLTYGSVPTPVSDEQFYDFCAAHPDHQIERTAMGEIVILPCAGGETSNRNMDLSAQLQAWTKWDGRGKAFDSSVEFLLPNGAARSPDASWVLRSRLAALSAEQKSKFLPLCPDFVVELRSPSDRLARLQAKMREWIDNGAQLGWLIDPATRAVYIYRRGRPVERLASPLQISGEGPVEAFRLEMADIWSPNL